MLAQTGNQAIISSICGCSTDLDSYNQKIGQGKMRRSGGRCAIPYTDMPTKFMIHSFTQYTFNDTVVNKDRPRLCFHRTYNLDAEIDAKKVDTY